VSQSRHQPIFEVLSSDFNSKALIFLFLRLRLLSPFQVFLSKITSLLHVYVFQGQLEVLLGLLKAPEAGFQSIIAQILVL
jgi:hypothetical protein